MALLVDTGVWSLALRRDAPPQSAAVRTLHDALTEGDDVYTCGMILLEMSRGVVPEKARDAIQKAFRSLEWIEPTRGDYELAAEVADTCRRHGVQLGTVDALIAQLAIRRDLTLLTTDRDFSRAADHVPLRLLMPA